MECSVSIIASLTDFEGFIPEWKALLETGEFESNFYQHPDVLRLMLENPEASLHPCIVVVRRGGRVSCIAPLYAQASRFDLMLSVLRVASWPVRLLRIAGDEFICRTGEPSHDSIDAVFRILQSRAPAFDLIRVFSLGMSGPLWTYFQSEKHHDYAVVASSSEPEKIIQARLGSDYREYLASLNGRVRQKLLRRSRDFWSHSKGTAQLVKVTDADQVERFLADVDAVYAQSWQSKTYGPLIRSTPGQIAYFAGIAKKGWLRSYVLKAPDPVAFVIGYQFGGIYHYDETSYDQRWADSGPGAVLTQQLIEDLFRSNTPATLDFGIGDGQYKRTLGNVEDAACAAYIVPRNRWRALLAVQRTLNRVYETTRSALIRLHLDARVRRIVKRRS